MRKPKGLAVAPSPGEDAGRRRLRDRAVVGGTAASITEQAYWLWETTKEETDNATEAFGLLLAQIVLELQGVQAMMSASVSRLGS